MKKAYLYELYDKLNVKSEIITKYLVYLKDFTDYQSFLFCSFCINNKDYITDDNFESFFLLFDSFDYILTKEYQEDIYELISTFFESDYIMCACDVEDIVDSIKDLISKITPPDVITENFDLDYYIYLCVSNYIKIVENIKNVPYDKMYSHSFSEICNYYEDVLDDLEETEIEEDELNDCVKRIESFVKVATDNYCLDSKKYYAVLRVASCIKSSKELNSFNKRVNRIPSDYPYEDFINKVDSYSDELTLATIEQINNLFGLKSKIDDEGNVVYTKSRKKVNANTKQLKNILCPSDNNIVKM